MPREDSGATANLRAHAAITLDIIRATIEVRSDAIAHARMPTVSRLGLRAKFLLLLAGMVVPMLAFGVYMFVRDRRLARDNLERDLERIAEVTSTGQTIRIQHLHDFLDALAHYPRLASQRWQECDVVLADFAHRVPDFLEIGIVAPDGHVLSASTPAPLSVDVKSCSWFARAAKDGKFAVGDFEAGPLTGAKGIALAQPIAAEGGAPVAFVFATTSNVPILTALKSAGLTAGGALSVIDGTGTIVAREPDNAQWVGHSIAEKPTTERILHEPAGIAEGVGVDGVKRIFAYHEIVRQPKGGGLHLSAGVPLDSALAEVDQEYLRLLVAFGLLSGLALAGVWLAGGRVLVRRTDALLEAARRIGAGDLSARTGLVDNGDELGELADSFDRTAGILEARTRENESVQRELRESDERFRLLVDGVRDYAIYLLDAQGRVVSWNAGAKQLEGFEAEEVLASSFERFYTPADVAAGLPKRALAQAARSGHFSEEGWRVRKDGSLFWAGDTMTALRDGDGSLRGFARVTHDMTVQRDREQALRAGEARVRELNAELEDRVAARTAELEAAIKELEAFSYSVSHDMRTPLRHINGYVNLLRTHCGTSLDEKGERYMKTIVEAGTRMGQLIDDILAFSRVGRVERRRVRVRMEDLVRSAWDELAADANGRDIRFSVDPLPEVEGDPALLRQAVANLLSNAIKYTRSRPVAHVHVGTRPDDAADVDEFFVQDDGVGFDMQYAHKLFGVFERLHDAARFEGTGIGLAIVHRIITRHGGSVRAESAPDEGAKFTFTIPRHP
jgi:PAS domain S-box-containing protein